MSDYSDFEPDWISPPGETIADILEEKDLSSEDFARRIGQTSAHVKDLIDGRMPITPDVAKRLAEVLGASKSFWVAREAQYRRQLERSHSKAGADTKVQWLAELPFRDMEDFGWIKPKSSATEDRYSACLSFFNVPDIPTWRDHYRGMLESYAFRTSTSFQMMPGAVAAWLRRGEIVAEAIPCKNWDKKLFKEALSEIRRLTWTSDPQVFLPKLQQLCAACGVAVVVARAPQGCRASGATRFLSPTKALLLLSFRYLSDDHFWFTFFHEAAHLLLHSKVAVFLEGADMVSTAEEDEANEFAMLTLIPQEHQNELKELGANGAVVIKFARRIGIAAGIVVGQLQHHGYIGRGQLNHLKRRYQWS